MAMTSIIYILGTICGIAVLFLLKFMQVVTRELHDSGTPQELFSLERGEYVSEEGRWRFYWNETKLRDSGGFLSDFRGRPERALSAVTSADRRSGEGGAVLRGRTGRFNPRQPGLQGVGTLVEQAHDHQECYSLDRPGSGRYVSGTERSH